MGDRIRRLAERVGVDLDEESDGADASHLIPLHAVTAQLLLATGAGATLEQLARPRPAAGDAGVPSGLAWAPLLVAPLAAAATLQHTRRRTERTTTALHFLTSAAVGLGAALFAADALSQRDRPPRRLGPLAFASAGLLGLVLEREERAIDREHQALERRARIVERLVPRRKAKLDHVVVHV